MPHERALEDAIGNMLERGIGKFRFVPRPDGFAVVREARADAPADEILLDETVFTSDVCDYAMIEERYAGGGVFRWGHACLLDVRVERQPRQITFELYMPLEREAR
jgi:hypothetical protein